jgi:hypothetical protein
MIDRLTAIAGRRPLRSVLPPILVAATLVSCTNSHLPQASSVLVVGDSVAAQSAGALVHLAPAETKVTVDAVQPGTAPCDWDHGFIDPTDEDSHRFADILRKVHPEVVVYVFTGNPGLSGPAAGCVDQKSPYDLSQLLASYEPPLLDMTYRAVRAGATVYLEAPPPRNPAVPVGYDWQHHVNRGFQGSSAIGEFYKSLVTAGDFRGWRYDDGAAVAVSTATLAWRLTLACELWDSKRCVNGQVPVRAGGADAVHLDASGSGAIRFALGLEQGALQSRPGPRPEWPNAVSVAATVSGYGGCQ